jgi:hypothetical protein
MPGSRRDGKGTRRALSAFSPAVEGRFAVKDRFPDRLFWPLAFLGLFAARIPYLVSPNRILDGDEAILGLMAKHTAAFTELPVFFWGQSYGFAIMETLPVAAAFRLFGVGPLVLSMTMFGLFLFGLWLYEGGFRNLTENRCWSRVLTLALGLLPVWIIWSFKARGGYLSAFVLGGLLLRLVTSREFNGLRACMVGCVVGLLFFAQPLWLAGFLPLLLLPLTRGAGLKEGGILAASAAATGAPIAYISSVTPTYWVPEVFGLPSLSPVLHLPETLHRMFTGFFYLEEILTTPWLVAVVGFLATTAWFLAVLTLGIRFAQSREQPLGLMFFALAGSLVGVLFLLEFQPRYLLQASVILMAASALLLGRSTISFSGLPRIVATVGLLALAVTATLVSAFRPIHPASESNLEAELGTLIQGLRERGVEGVYSMDALLQWQILFYGNEEVPVRFASPLDRRPEYPRRVDAALTTGGTVALVGTMSQAESLLQSPLAHLIQPVGDNYFILTDVSRPFLESIGFRFLPDAPS